MQEISIQESTFARGWKDTKAGWSSWKFWSSEVFGGGVLALWSAEAALISVAILAVAVWIVATTTAPTRQRDEARAAYRGKCEEIERLVLDKADLSGSVIQTVHGGLIGDKRSVVFLQLSRTPGHVQALFTHGRYRQKAKLGSVRLYSFLWRNLRLRCLGTAP